MPSVRKAKKKEDVGGQGAKEETNWNNLPNELKHACVKEMTIETRWKLRQTSHSERTLVDSVRLYAVDIRLSNNFLTLTRNATTLMIHFKFHRSKYIPFLVYLFTVLELKTLDPLKVKTKSLWNLIYERLPHEEEIPKAKEVLPIPSGIILPRFTKNDMQKIKIQRWLRDVRHQVFGSDPENWYHLFEKIADWQNFPPVVGAEIIVYDSEIKAKMLRTFLKDLLGKFL
ncbi:hypothetical protein CAEBREN_21966 [Caenorhabditis brenneri]|uniref:F-box domain-containing protein n=1 Tax=Caenorhabditis brenneri TaxID=135651 RepID=G0PN39_CAEBE|nr:hypothetical protein CAEBREN_21966 [Caenorhabditis brenneri]